VAIANRAVQPQVHHLLQVWIKATFEMTKRFVKMSQKNFFSFLASRRRQLNTETRNIKHTIW
jgi:hypothetical protein